MDWWCGEKVNEDGREALVDWLRFCEEKRELERHEMQSGEYCSDRQERVEWFMEKNVHRQCVLLKVLVVRAILILTARLVWRESKLSGALYQFVWELSDGLSLKWGRRCVTGELGNDSIEWMIWMSAGRQMTEMVAGRNVKDVKDGEVGKEKM